MARVPGPAALVGYVEYPVVGLESGLAPLSALSSNVTALLNGCIAPGTGPLAPLFAGRLACARSRLQSPAVLLSLRFTWSFE